MMKQFDKSTPKLAQDVKVRFLKEDERGKFYVIGRSKETAFLRIHQVGKYIVEMLDGQTTIAQIKAMLKQRNIEVDLPRFIKLLGRKGLLKNYQSDITTKKETKLRVFYFPFIKKPEGILSRIHFILSRFLKERFLTCFFAFNTLLALFLILSISFGLLSLEEEFFVWRSPFLALLVSFFVIIPFLGILHELAHAVTCFHYGGRPSEIGVAWYLFTFFFYADTSDVWVLDKKKSILVFLAGPLMTLFIGNICLSLYLLSRVPFKEIFLVIAFGSYLSVLFGFNPLIESDGYYILETWVDFPNLHSHAWSYASSWLSRKLRLLSKGQYEEFVTNYSKNEKRVLAVYTPLAIIMNCIVIVIMLSWTIAIFSQLIALTLQIFENFPMVEATTIATWIFQGAYVFVTLIYSSLRIFQSLIHRIKARA